MEEIELILTLFDYADHVSFLEDAFEYMFGYLVLNTVLNDTSDGPSPVFWVKSQLYQ